MDETFGQGWDTQAEGWQALRDKKNARRREQRDLARGARPKPSNKLTLEQKAWAVRQSLTRSDREVAAELGVTHRVVGRLRASVHLEKQMECVRGDGRYRLV